MLFLLFLKYLFIQIIFLLEITASECPAQENITPCICSIENNKIHIQCTKVQSLQSLQSAMQSLKGFKVVTLIIEESTFDYLPADIFQDIKITSILISKSKFSRIGNLGDAQFQGLNHSLEAIYYQDVFSEAHPLAYVSLQHLQKLHTFDLKKSYVGLVHNLWFKDGPESLKEVKFSQAKILNVQYKAFASLKNLRVIDLSDNEINFMTRTMLPNPAVHLQEIYLERNKLESFSNDFFEGMPQLKRVNLELNDFSTIEENVWSKVWNHLQFLNIDYSPLICDKNIKWIFLDGQNLENKLVGTCYKPFKLIERELNSLEIKELI